MVIDFYDIKKLMTEIIKPMDHKLILPAKSSRLKIDEEGPNLRIKVIGSGKAYSIPREDTCLLPIPETTAECIAKFIHESLRKKLSNFQIRVIINENIGSHAVYSD